MKAHKGEEIVCKCPKPAGRFHRDVEDGASISSDDIAIFTWLCTLDALAGRWTCKTCKATVAEQVSGGWRVNTRKGWLE